MDVCEVAYLCELADVCVVAYVCEVADVCGVADVCKFTTKIKIEKMKNMEKIAISIIAALARAKVFGVVAWPIKL